MFSHIQLAVRDMTRMQPFYDAVLAELGLVRVPEDEAGVIWQRADRRWPQFVLRGPLNGLLATGANGSQVSFAAPSPDAAAAAWSVALTFGAINEGEPGFGRSMPRISIVPTAAILRGINSVLSTPTG